MARGPTSRYKRAACAAVSLARYSSSAFSAADMLRYCWWMLIFALTVVGGSPPLNANAGIFPSDGPHW